MNKLILVLTTMLVLAVVSCNNNSTAKVDHDRMNHDSMPVQVDTIASNDVKLTIAKFTNVDPQVSSYVKGITQYYLVVKNALSNSNEPEAAVASAKILSAVKKFDKSLLTSDQKKLYDTIEDDLKEHSWYISDSKLDVQREHFAMMSKNFYGLAKAFGAGITLYHDYCPMYKNGAIWLSETEEIRNPYYGDKMMSCGSVEEIIN